ncbi:LysR family transcriptional regulator [Acetobacterium sp. UBA5834]|jgi:LysR family cyn operon transcriptional activator|uniref:LysR substrate-binding domain-containing protein n=1 Tax=Acetobacterium sp. UBA5834 TaxID=1945907 RepID=UPI00257A1CAD|nr:LysR family transcriptional regulator [Acetobacterium sp. UBA5834]
MIPSGLLGITLQQIEIFLTAAKYENFTKAAATLHMTQASISRNIQSLEYSTGLVLFLRHKQHVRLTNAGKKLAELLPEILTKTENAVEKAFLQQKNQFQSLVIGDFSSTSMDSYLLPITKAFETAYPDVDLKIERDDPDRVLTNVSSGLYDATFFTYAGISRIEDSNLQYQVLFLMPPTLVISDVHPLFTKDEINDEDLKNLTLVTMDGEEYEEYRTFVSVVCQSSGITYKRVKKVDSLFTLAMELKRSESVAILDNCFAPMNPKELRYISLFRASVHSGIIIVFSANNSNPFLLKFREICKEVCDNIIRDTYND